VLFSNNFRVLSSLFIGIQHVYGAGCKVMQQLVVPQGVAVVHRYHG